MLGFLIIVYPEGAKLTKLPQIQDPETVAHWLVGYSGIDWLEDMVKTGLATCLNSSGYPCQYRMLWKDLLPELLIQPKPHRGPPVIGEGYAMESGWTDPKKINREALARRQSDDWMIVDAWDQS